MLSADPPQVEAQSEYGPGMGKLGVREGLGFLDKVPGLSD